LDLPRYRSPEGARAYRRKYASPLRALSSWRETRLVARALAQAGAEGPLLDCPCGAGRLIPALARRGARVTAVDLSKAMVREAGGTRALRLVGSADALPFADGAFDTVVCHRLLHHFAEPEGRARVLRELARVARRAVVLSFSDAGTRRARRSTRRAALTAGRLRAEAAACGLRLEPPVRRVCGWFSVVAVAVLRSEA
jgi:SAM-dependent methyltransferase